jgi:hypothetical protein
MLLEGQEKYIAELEETIRKFLKPLRDVPFTVAMRAVSGHSVIPFNKKDSKDQRLLKDLVEAARIAAGNANAAGIVSARANEVGNKMEPYVTKALNQVGLNARKPQTAEGKAKATGYPDILVTDKSDRPNYLDCKTYNEKNYQTTQRSFYFSPAPKPGDFKVRHDARHFVFSFKIERGKRNDRNVFIPVEWKIFTIENLIGQIKHEFNASNRQMYRSEALLAEGPIEDDSSSPAQETLSPV